MQSKNLLRPLPNALPPLCARGMHRRNLGINRLQQDVRPRPRHRVVVRAPGDVQPQDGVDIVEGWVEQEGAV